ncbi:LPP20 family lipoprotein [Megamonas hypermegale]|uniref:LPP20 family lipoprotein n=1 Tax=Megamonas hypermegale TaxID=158847 RepID=UPI001956291F|nr:LPP20 family lipoprotein [Megamonas hypermegale]MBM6833710.1 LPP20 family lipoprotein [Megamonas hypermegale]
MKKIIYICIMVFFCWFNVASAQQITVSGYGTTTDEAERDALRNAVEQAVGTLVDSATLVQNNMLINDEIYTQSRGYITNYTVVSQKMNGDGTYEVMINANVDTNPNSKLMNELTRLGIINRQLRDPKIAVVIPEYHIRARVPDPAGETAVIRKLIDAGFSRITDISDTRYSLNKLSALTKQDMENIARSRNVDILIVGEAFSEGVGDVGKFLPNGGNTGIVSCKARLEAKIFIAKTGQIISANGTYGTAADLTEFIAGKKALNDAGEKMGDYIVEKLLNYGSSTRQNLEVVVTATDFNKINAINSAIQKIRGVESSMVTDYNNGKATLSVKFSGTPQTLFNQLNQAVNFNINMQSLSYNTLSISAY